MLKNKCVKKEGRVLERFFLDHLLYKIWGKKNYNTIYLQKK
jgi:hypothetical protein